MKTSPTSKKPTYGPAGTGVGAGRDCARADRSRRPRPSNPTNCGLTAEISLAEASTSSVACGGCRSDLASRARAIAPETKGADIEVPVQVAYCACCAVKSDKMDTPGAVI